MLRQSPSGVLLATGIVAVLRAADAQEYRPIVAELLDGGIACIELTLTTPRTLAELPELRAKMPSAEIGVGTVLTPDEATAAIDAGAQFIVTPCPLPEVMRIAIEHQVPVYPGAATPGEVHANWQAGASAVKLFPAETLGSGYLTHLLGPFPDLLALPSGGVALDDIESWIGAGAVAVSLGGPLIGDALTGGPVENFRDRVRQARDAVARARSAR